MDNEYVYYNKLIPKEPIFVDEMFFVDDEYAGTVKLTNLDNGESNISFPSCDDGLIINPADKHIK